MAPGTVNYFLLHTKRALRDALDKISGPCALDFETTTLVPEEGRVRLVQLCNDDVRVVVDFDQIKGGFRACADLFDRSDAQWVVFNTGFELRWFQYAGVEPTVWDVQHLRRAILGGSRLSLALMAKYDLEEEIDKGQQGSDWSAPKLSWDQLNYAFIDADVTWRLWKLWAEKADPGRWACFKLLCDLDPPVIEMEQSGMKLDEERHGKLVEQWKRIQAERLQRVRALVGEDEVSNVNSDSQWSDYFSRLLPDHVLKNWPKTEKSGQLQMTNDTLAMMAGMFPGTPLEEFFDALGEYKKISKYINSFGETLITKNHLAPDRRIHCRFNIGAAKTLRFSSSGPNMQQIPRDKDNFFGETLSIRQSFVAGMGRRIIALDYSGIELRVLALLAGDEQLLEDAVQGQIHDRVAEFMAGRKVDKRVPADNEIRTKAKGVSFGTVYGSGAAGLASTLRKSMYEAQQLLDFWGNRYPRAFNLRYEKLDEAERTRYIRMVDGGTIYMGKKPELPKCANYPVQRAAWSIMARAIKRHHDSLKAERRAGRQRMTRTLGTIHDELLDEASTRDAQACYDLLERDMTQAYLDIFPGAPTDNLVEGGIGKTWGDVK